MSPPLLIEAKSAEWSTSGALETPPAGGGPGGGGSGAPAGAGGGGGGGPPGAADFGFGATGGFALAVAGVP